MEKQREMVTGTPDTTFTDTALHFEIVQVNNPKFSLSGNQGVFMEFRDIFNTTREAIESKNWNPYLGISINNKYFTQEHIAAFASWGVEYCRDGFALLVVDILQRINNEVFDKSKIEKAMSKAFRQSDVILDACRQAVSTL
ncbi:MAG: hypothetical protein ACOY4F_03855, partial [Thermodesulfobacteriota bacterium]